MNGTGSVVQQLPQLLALAASVRDELHTDKDIVREEKKKKRRRREEEEKKKRRTYTQIQHYIHTLNTHTTPAAACAASPACCFCCCF
jgi:hypothetical protein